MFDILPDETSSEGSSIPGSPTWLFVEETIRQVMSRFNYEEIRTPVLEELDLVARGVGATTDIVSKEMFIVDRGENQYVLRPEITAPVVRSYLQHHLDQRGGVGKLYYIGPCFRAESPQKGRYRQFHQFGCEVLGADDARADAEVIALMVHVYRTFGIASTRLRINTLGDADTRPAYREALQNYFEPYKSELTETSRRRLETNPLRILDTKDENERRLLDDAPRLIDFVGEEALAHYDSVKALLHDLDIVFEEDPFLVRGLDYYSRTAFELESPDLGAQSALAGGGRYDLLATEIGSKKPVPATGFAAGIERLMLAMDAAGTLPESKHAPDLFLVSLGEEATRWSFTIAHRLREAGLHIGLDLKGRSMKAQMREANRSQSPLVAIVGQDELEQGEVTLKNMGTGEQERVSADDLANRLTASAPPNA